MKSKITMLLIFSLPLLLLRAQTIDPSPYCNSTYGYHFLSLKILKVEVRNLSNSALDTAARGYIYFNNLSPLNLSKDSMQIISVTYSCSDMETMLKGWIDYNNNHVFEPSEKIIDIPQGSITLGSNKIKQASFTVPHTATSGKTRMRISFGWHFADWTNLIFKLDSCHTVSGMEYTAGETEDFDVIISGTTSIHEKTVVPGFTIYPNPTNGKTTIEVQGNNSGENIEFSVFDLPGVKVFSGTFTGKKEINLDGLKRGIYIVRLTTNSGKNIFGFLVKD